MTSLLAFFLLICLLVFVHEYGHFWAARKCGVSVQRFSIGFGKVIWRRKDKYGTEFAFSMIPLGGYVQMDNGEAPPSASSLKQKTVLKRAFIISAGPAANFLFAIAAYWLVFSLGVPTVKPIVDSVEPNTIAATAKLPAEFEFKKVDDRTVHDWEEVILALVGKIGSQAVEIEGISAKSNVPQRFILDLSEWQLERESRDPLTTLGIRPKSAEVDATIQAIVENSPAEQSGLQAGDILLSINKEAFNWQKLLMAVQTGNPLSIDIQRENETKTFILQPQKLENGRYQIGLQPTFKPLAEEYRTELKYDILSAFKKALTKVADLVETILQFIGKLFTGNLSLDNMGGPLSIAKGAGATAELGLIYYLSFMALISVNLAVMNLFPILPLDGGQLLLLSAEALRGKPLSEKFQIVLQQFGMVFVIGLMCFVLFNDLLHF